MPCIAAMGLAATALVVRLRNGMGLLRRQEGGAVDVSEVAQHEAALQGCITLAHQAAAGDRFTESQLKQASEPLQVPLAGLLPGNKACYCKTAVSS